jgi:tetratricopeptide (TPR) repeat protein
MRFSSSTGIPTILSDVFGRLSQLCVSFSLLAIASAPLVALAIDANSTTSPDENEKLSQKRAEAGNKAWAKRESTQAFNKIFDSIGADPKQRDYRTILENIKILCEKYPGSEPAYKAIFAVEQWEKAGYVPNAEAKHFLAFRDKYNPAKEDLVALHTQWKESVDTDVNPAAIRGLIQKLQKTAEDHPGTESEFIALAGIASLFDRLGQHRESLQAAEQFLTKFPYEKVDYPSVDTYVPMNLALRARLKGRTESLDAGLEAFDEIADQFQGRPQGLAALLESGDLALNNHRPQEAVKILEKVVSKYDAYQQDNRVIVARFKLVGAVLQLGDKERALTMATHLLTEFGDNPHWKREAEQFIQEIQKPNDKVVSRVDDLALNSPPSPSSSGFNKLIALNLILVIILGVFVAYRRLRRA